MSSKTCISSLCIWILTTILRSQGAPPLLTLRDDSASGTSTSSLSSLLAGYAKEGILILEHPHQDLRFIHLGDSQLQVWGLRILDHPSIKVFQTKFDPCVGLDHWLAEIEASSEVPDSQGRLGRIWRARVLEIPRQDSPHSHDILNARRALLEALESRRARGLREAEPLLSPLHSLNQSLQEASNIRSHQHSFYIEIRRLLRSLIPDHQNTEIPWKLLWVDTFRYRRANEAPKKSRLISTALGIGLAFGWAIQASLAQEAYRADLKLLLAASSLGLSFLPLSLEHLETHPFLANGSRRLRRSVYTALTLAPAWPWVCQKILGILGSNAL